MSFAAFIPMHDLLSRALIILLLLPFRTSAQDTLGIEDVTVVTRKSGFAHLGKKSERIDSSVMEQFRFASVSELLAPNSAVFIKTYGSGGIATTALRGGNAEQTAVLWNGMNMQNSMLGQTDLGLVPAILFESVGVDYGGSTAMWGSGAVGGSIHLDNKSFFGKRFNVTTGVGGGSIGQFNSSAVITAGTEKLVNTTKVYAGRSANRFNYLHPSSDGVATMTSAAFQARGVMNEFKAALGSQQIISLNTWLSGSDRRIPGYDPAHAGKLYQDDNAMRLLGSWSYSHNKFRTQIRSAYFNERLDFNDSIMQLYSKSRTQTLMIDNENFLRWGRGHEFYAGLSHLTATAGSDNYDGQQMLARTSLLAGNKFLLMEERLVLGMNARAEYFSAGTLPVTGNLSAEFDLTRDLRAGLNVSRVYRQPTLNELYWLPGGNPDLLPEQGEAVDGVLSYRKIFGYARVKITAAAFSRNINNWILWVPGAGGNPSPLNLQQVWSRGAETSWKLDWKRNRFSSGLYLASSYILSTIEKTRAASARSIGKQLIYTPRYTYNGHIYGGFKHTNLYCFFQYAGYRFTTSDNSQWLEPYAVFSLRLTHAFDGVGMRFVTFAACNNLLNSSYLVMAGRPMPLRYYEAGLTIHFKIKQQKIPPQ